MNYRCASSQDLEGWVQLRQDLWPRQDRDSLVEEAGRILVSEEEVCFLAIDDAGRPAGFLEGAIHGGPEGPYAHVEGWYVRPTERQRGHGRELLGLFEQWCLHRAIRTLTSDTNRKYPLSPAAHRGCGFRPICEFTIFLKELSGSRGPS